MAVFKNYSFEYNAKAVDIFTAIAVCSYADEMNNFREGCKLDIDDANFYGIIALSKNSGERFSIEVTAESYARELRNNKIESTTELRQSDAIRIIKDYLLPEGWIFEYPESFDLYPKYISYVLRNGTYISHISNIIQLLGLDFTIFTTKSGDTYTKTVKAYYRDNFTGITPTSVEEWKNIGNLSITVDYGKIATSITVLGADTEVGTDQSLMDAEMGNWDDAPHVYEIKDTQLKTPEFSTTSNYLYYYPASPDDYTIGLVAVNDIINIGDEKMIVSAVNYLPAIRVASYESGELTDADLPTYLQAITNYQKDGAIVLTVTKGASIWFESVQDTITVSDRRNVNAYCSDSAVHAIYDEILLSSAKITVSPYLTFNKNLPSAHGFVWFGSERIFYRTGAVYDSNLYLLSDLIRGVPTCGTASCQHCGTRAELRPIGWSYGCPYGGTDTDIGSYCTLMSAVKTALGVTANKTECPLCFDNESVCPILKCPFVKNDTEFATLCPKGLKQSEIVWTQKYSHHKDALVFPDSYYYNDSGTDVYEEYARDSLISRYGYVPTQVSAKGVADADTLDKVAEGYLRLSALPIVGKFTAFHFAPWVIPDGYYPGDVVSVRVASHGRYDLADSCWYPTQWFDFASGESVCPGDPDEWMEIPAGSGDWYKLQQSFVIQKTTKSQRGAPIIQFGTDAADFQSIMEYIRDTADSSSQRHANQRLGQPVAVTTNGYAAQVKDIKTGKSTWVRMVK